MSFKLNHKGSIQNHSSRIWEEKLEKLKKGEKFKCKKKKEKGQCGKYDPDAFVIPITYIFWSI